MVTTFPMPTFAGVLAASERIARYGVADTPLRRWSALSRLVGAEVFVKHENHLPTGAFKIRGGINLVSQLDEGERASGVIAASTGNHGQCTHDGASITGVMEATGDAATWHHLLDRDLHDLRSIRLIQRATGEAFVARW